MAISSYSNPIPEIIDGLLRGHQLGLQMQQAARAQQEFLTNQALHNQEMSMNDIKNKMLMQEHGARTVGPGGTVQDYPTLQAPGMPISPGSSGAAGGKQQGDLYNLPTRPGPTMPGQQIDYQAPASTVQSSMLTPSMPISPGSQGPPPDVSNLPQQAGPTMPGQTFSYLRKADKSRTIDMPDRFGNKTSYELPTEEERRQEQQAATDLANQNKAKAESWIEAAKLKAIQDQADSVLKLRGVEVPPELAAWHHTLPGTKVMPDKLEAMWKEYDTANAAKEVPEGGSLVNPRTGQLVFKGTPKLDAEQRFEKAWAEDHNTTPDKMTGAQKMQAFWDSKKDPTGVANALAAREEARAFREQVHADAQTNAAAQRGEMSYRFHAGELDKEGKPIGELENRVSLLNGTLAQNTPQADAAVAAQLVQILEGGQGSGLRMNKDVITRMMGGATKWEQFKSAASQWSLDPKTAKIQPEQRQQIRDLANMVNQKVQAKQQVLSEARTGLMNSNDPMEHRRILTAAKDKLVAVDSPGPKKGDPKDYGGRHYIFDGKEWVAQ